LLGIGEAIANCQETLPNGRLFEPRDETTHNSVVAAALGILSQAYWLGIDDTLSEGQFQYLSGGDLTFSNWNSGMHIIVLLIESSQFKRKTLKLCKIHYIEFLIIYFVICHTGCSNSICMKMNHLLGIKNALLSHKKRYLYIYEMWTFDL
jgi:hypothetical protein